MIITSLILFFATIGSGIGSFVSSFYSDQQMTQVQDSVNATKTLSKINNDIALRIKELQEVNNEITIQSSKITSNTRDLAFESKNLTRKNLKLFSDLKPTVDKVENLSNHISSLADTIYNVQTGANSIPVITAETVYNDYCYYYKPNPPEITGPFCNQFITMLRIKNNGSYPIGRISLRNEDWDGQTVERSNYDIVSLYPTEETAWRVPIILGDSQTIKNSYTKRWRVFVSWKTKYVYELGYWQDGKTGQRILKEMYHYKNGTCFRPDVLIRLIQKDLQSNIIADWPKYL